MILARGEFLINDKQRGKRPGKTKIRTFPKGGRSRTVTGSSLDAGEWCVHLQLGCGFFYLLNLVCKAILGLRGST